MRQLGSRTARPATTSGRVLITLFFLLFVGMGILLCTLFWQAAVETKFWNPVDCVIMESRVDAGTGREAPYRFRVRYQYHWQDQTFTGDQWSDSGGSVDYSQAQRLAEQYRVDTKTICYVNPKNPAKAVLKRSSPWLFLLVLPPLFFVGLGVWSLWRIWRRSAAKVAEDPSPAPEPISARAPRPAQTRVGLPLLVCGGFLIIGGVVSYFVFLVPLAQTQAAKTWLVRPCTVISSRVQSHSGESTTYSVDILYAYEVGGREFRSNRYKFMGGSSSGYQGKVSIVHRYPAGSKAVCYVNPADPAQAVLERGFTGDMWLGLIPVGFGLAGAGGLAATFRSRRNARAGAQAAGPATGPEPLPLPIRQIVGPVIAPSSTGPGWEDADPACPRVLKPSSSRVGAFIFFLVFTAVWNGILYFAFLRQGLFGRGSNAFGLFVSLFMLPFIAVGVIMLGATIYQFLALYNPKAELTIHPGAPSLGESLELSWRLIGRTRALRGLKLYLEGREEATHRQGTRTQTDRQPFLTIAVATPASAEEMVCGRAQVNLPADTVPSFKSENNRIIWAIHVRGDIPRWPDLKEEFEIQVRPGARTAAA